MEPNDTIILPIIQELISSLANCFGVTINPDEPGFFALLYNCLKDIIGNIIGAFFLLVVEVATWPSQLMSALAKYLEGDTKPLEELVLRIATKYNSIIDWLTNAKNYIISNCLKFYDSFCVALGNTKIETPPIPLDDISLPEINISIDLPPNQKYRELPENSWWKGFNPGAIILMVINFISMAMEFVVGYITDLLKFLVDIINLVIDKIAEATNKIIEWVSSCINFLENLIRKTLKKLAGCFNISLAQVDEFFDRTLDKILIFDTNMDDLPEWMRKIYKFCLCVIRFIFSFGSTILQTI